MKFNELEIIKPIHKALDEIGYEEATPIQEKSIPIILEGKDLLATAETGTGKTAAFAIPMLQNFFNNPVSHTNIRGLVIAPTRELAQQIYESYLEYSKFIGVEFSVIFGGVPQKRQERILKRNPQIIIATPGRLMDLMDQKIVDLRHVEMVVLDEADRLLDMGFVHDIDKIVSSVPENAQTLLFSATMPKGVIKLADKFMVNPETVKTARVSAPASTIKQRLYYVDPDNKKELLKDILNAEFNDSVLVFVRTKVNAERLMRYLNKEGFSAMALHGDKSQNQRSRALEGFKTYKFQVLVATDVAARGIDIEKLGCVVNFNIPSEAEVYVHRIGRTGRAGETGESIAFADWGERELVKDVEKVMNHEIEVIEDHPYPMVDQSIQPPDNRSRKSKGKGGGKGRGRRGGKSRNRNRSNSSNSRPRSEGDRKQGENSNSGSKPKQSGERRQGQKNSSGSKPKQGGERRQGGNTNSGSKSNTGNRKQGSKGDYGSKSKQGEGRSQNRRSGSKSNRQRTGRSK